jgi:hypothetical protein
VPQSVGKAAGQFDVINAPAFFLRKASVRCRNVRQHCPQSILVQEPSQQFLRIDGFAALAKPNLAC